MILLKIINQRSVCAFDIHKSTKITYAYIHYMKKYFLKREWITIQKEGRAHNMIITNDGKKIIKAIDDLLEATDISFKDVMKYRRCRKDSEKKKEKKEQKEKQETVDKEVKKTIKKGTPFIKEVEPDITEQLDEKDIDTLKDESTFENKKVILDLSPKIDDFEESSPDELKEIEEELDVEEDWSLDDDEEEH